MMRRLAASVACGVATFVVFVAIASRLPLQSAPSRLVAWELNLFDRLLPRAPGEIVNINALIAGTVAGAVLFTAIFFCVFTLIARRR